MHIPVLLHEAVGGLNVKRHCLYIDATVGEGGHMLEIAKRGGRVMGIDWDEEQIKNDVLRHPEFISGSESGKQMLKPIRQAQGKRVQHDIRIVQGNFADIEKIAKSYDFFPVDGILFDLGLSMRQITSSGRGFSYEKPDEPLDMRINTGLAVSASLIINSYTMSQIYEIMARFGEEINSLAISQTLVRARSLKKIIRVGDLIKIIDKVLGKKDRRTYARIFQALRISVNNELENLKKGLVGALAILKQPGRIVVISFHSLEDRIVKQFIQTHQLRQIRKKVIRGDREKPFERSAVLRIIEN